MHHAYTAFDFDDVELELEMAHAGTLTSVVAQICIRDRGEHRFELKATRPLGSHEPSLNPSHSSHSTMRVAHDPDELVGMTTGQRFLFRARPAADQFLQRGLFVGCIIDSHRLGVAIFYNPASLASPSAPSMYSK